MCYGGLDPKYQMREIDARVKTLTFEQDTLKQAPHAPFPALVVWVMGVVAWLRRKDHRHV